MCLLDLDVCKSGISSCCGDPFEDEICDFQALCKLSKIGHQLFWGIRYVSFNNLFFATVFGFSFLFIPVILRVSRL